MSYAVQIGAGGYAGWKLLQRTGDMQREALSKSAQVTSNSTYYKANFDKIRSADDLVSNYRMLKITLTAFGLEDDINNRAFLRKVLESDLGNSDSFANKLSDKRYLKMATALGLGSDKPAAGAANRIIEKYIDQTFQGSVGERDNNLRLALNVKTELADVAASAKSVNAFWYTVLGSTPLKKVFEGAFGLPSSFGKIPIDRQLDEYKNRAERMFGSSAPATFQDEDTLEKLARTFLVRSQISQQASVTPYTAALTLLQARR